RFITNFSKIAKTLTLLTQKDKKFKWGDEEENAFQTLKDMLYDALILALPEGPDDFVVYCDASNQGFGCVLMQRNKVIASSSRQLKIHEKNYTTHDLELGVVVFDFKMWRYYSIKARILEARCEASKDVNTLAEMLRGLDKQFERKEDGKLYFPEIPEWKWENITMDFITRLPRTSSRHDAIWIIVDRLTKSAHFLAVRENDKTEKLARVYINKIVARYGTDGQKFSYNNSYHSSVKCAPFEALYGRKCRTPIAWTEVGEIKLIGPEIVQETTDKILQIKERLKTPRDRQKSYADNWRKLLEFSVGDKVLLKVSPWKGIVRFDKRSKLSPRYIGPFKIVKRFGPVAYRLRLLQELVGIHDTFHVSNLKKCMADVKLHVPLEEIKVDKGLHFVEEPIEVMDQEVKKLKQSKILIVKVRWNSR
ncbi:putative reverse transcriptase domain-containing protein, partial [Tanacetum coccineum]